jgi:hypothetical protein
VVAAAPPVPGMLTRMAGMPLPSCDAEYSAIMKISATSTSTDNVSGKRMMMVFAALNPGIAPTILPRITAGIITHQNCSE